jgi:hypothetical protein
MLHDLGFVQNFAVGDWQNARIVKYGGIWHSAPFNVRHDDLQPQARTVLERGLIVHGGQE